MTAMAAAKAMTVEEFLALDITPIWPWNLVDGELVVNSPDPPHQELAAQFIGRLFAWIAAGDARGRVLVPLDVLIDGRNVYRPDVVWYAPVHPPGKRPFAVPDLAVEIRSPSTWHHDTGAKKDGYERAGLPELWLVDEVTARVLVYRRSGPRSPTFDVTAELGRGDTLESPQLPGFALPLDDLF